MAYDYDDLCHSLRGVMDSEKISVVAFTGHTVRQQERVLGYRFSRRRASEGLHPIVDDDGLISTKLFDPLTLDAPDKISTHILGNYSGTHVPIPDDAASYVKHVDSGVIWKAGDWTIANPSSYFLTHQDVASYSPYGDFIDETPGDLLTLGELEQRGLLAIVRGAVYSKADEVPSPTATRILTAANIDLASRTLKLSEFRYLRPGVELDDARRPLGGDIVICGSSGSLKHLGKIATVAEGVDAYIGGFLLIVRPKDLGTRKTLEYNLVSRRFRELVTSMKEQNISNLTASKLRAFPLHVPRDMAAFLEACATHEAD